ncbi:uncharacterized protein LOC141628489 [Silene latifolia]|uniref:uncharacterized protein LOC141628489 n=1 Tax=Silene latifolia TaxID=37657 RepID=UPI003D77DFE1
MTPYEALYERKCRSPLCWDDKSDEVMLGPKMILEMVEQVQLRKYVSMSDSTHRLEPENVKIDQQFSYVELPKEILDRKVKKTRNGETVLVKVLWFNHNVEEATWEAKTAIKEKYLHLFI